MFSTRLPARGAPFIARSLTNEQGPSVLQLIAQKAVLCVALLRASNLRRDPLPEPDLTLESAGCTLFRPKTSLPHAVRSHELSLPKGGQTPVALNTCAAQRSLSGS